MLNVRQKAFCEYYVACGNATEAAIKAGYNKKSAKATASRMLTNVNLQNYIKELMEKMEQDRIATAEEVLKYLTSTLRGEVEEEVVVVEGCGDGFSEATKVKKQVSIKDRVKAAELLGKRYSLFSDKVKIEGTVPVMIVGEDELDE